MTEKKLEEKIIGHFENALSTDFPNIQIVGQWQTNIDGQLKALENPATLGALTIRVSPRRYETATIPDCEIPVEIQLNIRSDVDVGGESWLSATDAANNVIQNWQDWYSRYAQDLSVENEFHPTGFRTDGGDCGIDRQAKVWQWTQTFTLLGVIEKR